jgi:hypothetical protein
VNSAVSGSFCPSNVVVVFSFKTPTESRHIGCVERLKLALANGKGGGGGGGEFELAVVVKLLPPTSEINSSSLTLWYPYVIVEALKGVLYEKYTTLLSAIFSYSTTLTVIAWVGQSNVHVQDFQTHLFCPRCECTQCPVRARLGIFHCFIEDTHACICVKSEVLSRLS